MYTLILTLACAAERPPQAPPLIPAPAPPVLYGDCGCEGGGECDCAQGACQCKDDGPCTRCLPGGCKFLSYAEAMRRCQKEDLVVLVFHKAKAWAVPGYYCCQSDFDDGSPPGLYVCVKGEERPKASRRPLPANASGADIRKEVAFLRSYRKQQTANVVPPPVADVSYTAPPVFRGIGFSRGGGC